MLKIMLKILNVVFWILKQKIFIVSLYKLIIINTTKKKDN